MSTWGRADVPPAGAERPWSPYPVQDWQALPESYSPVSPDWRPPQDPRPSWLPFLVIGLVACLIAGGFYVADRFGERPFSHAAQAFVPADGAVRYSRRESGSNAPEGVAQLVTESARFTGAAQLTALDFTFGSKVLGSLEYDDLPGTPFWRTTTTELGHPTSSQQLVRVYRADAAVELVGESGPEVAYVYRPALVELPADAAPGRTWTGAGSAGDTLGYRSEFRAAAGDRGCLRVTGTITYTALSGQPGTTTSVDKTWCPAEGITASTTVTDDATTTVTGEAAPASEPELRSISEPVAWAAPQSWRQQTFSSVSIDQNFGQQIMTGAPASVPPVLTASGLIIRGSSSQDLVAFTPKTPTQWTSLWRMHPGGTVLSLAAFGDVVVATTSERQVVAYSDAGVRLWHSDLDELAFRGPVRVNDDTIAVVDSGGTVRLLDIRSGAQRWQRDVGAEVTTAPVADPRAVIVFDGSDTATAYDPATGTELWQRELDVDRATVVGDTVVTHTAATLTAVALATGRSRWLQPVTGTVDALQAFDGRVVLATQLDTTILDENGTVRARRPPYEVVTATSQHLVGWGINDAEVIDRDLTTVKTLDTPDRTLSSSGLYPLSDRFGVLLFAGDWSFETWSDQP